MITQIETGPAPKDQAFAQGFGYFAHAVFAIGPGHPAFMICYATRRAAELAAEAMLQAAQPGTQIKAVANFDHRLAQLRASAAR